MSGTFLFWDTETASAGKQYGMSPRKFIRTFQYAWDDGPVQETVDYDQMIKLIKEAKYLVAHNQSSYDLPVLFGPDSLEPLRLALNRKVIDTFILGSLVNPAPYSYQDKKGHMVYDGASPERAKKWLSLEEQAHQLGVPGKMGDLRELAKKYNPPKTKVADLDFSLIPLDDPDFEAYRAQDVIAVRHIYRELLKMVKEQGYSGDYIWREMTVWAINAQITKNGVRVDIPEAQDRVEHLKRERDEIMDWLVSEYGFPTEGKQPWKSAAGKEAILKALNGYGITPKHDKWTKTAKGAPSFSGDTMIAVTEGTKAEKLGQGLATLQGQRSLAQLALESVYEDGKAHPSIMCLQRSGRTSVQNPGLTVWTARGPGAVEKRYFVPDEGEKMVSMDFSSADARAMAALSGDAAYAVQFEVNDDGTPRYDSHNLVGEAAFGKERYWKDVPEGVTKPPLRDPSKIISHSTNYNVGAKKLAAGMNEACEKAGLDIRFTVEEAKGMLNNFDSTYPLLKRFKNVAVDEGDLLGYVENPWGRRMKVDEGRSFTQSPALQGQSVTRERMYDGLIRIALDKIECIRWVKFPVHDELVLSIPVDDLGWGVPYFQESMSGVFDPKDYNPDWHVGQPIEFLMSAGDPADNWWKAGH